MAASEAALAGASTSAAALPAIEPLALADVAGGLALSDAAGWNQTADDWALFIARGRAIGVRDAAGSLVATAAALPYGERRGWISMVLVADAWRHRGLASRLVDACVDALRGRGLVPVLDATPAGAEVYRRIGFVGGFAFDRWQRDGSSTPSPAPLPARSPVAGSASVVPAGPGDLDAIAACDAAASGLDRHVLLESFLNRPSTRAWRTADPGGFVIARAGRRATQIGPLVASGPAQAAALLEAALAGAGASFDGRVFLDLPSRQAGVAAVLAAQGWSVQRSFVRMALGAPEPPALDARSVVLAGPEFG